MSSEVFTQQVHAYFRDRGEDAFAATGLGRGGLPAPADEHDLARLFYRVYRTSDQVERFPSPCSPIRRPALRPPATRASKSTFQSQPPTQLKPFSFGLNTRGSRAKT
jgi:hypothetical protein